LNPDAEDIEELQKKFAAAKGMVKELKREVRQLKSEKSEPIDIEEIKNLTRAESVSEIDQLRAEVTKKTELLDDITAKFENLRQEFQEHRKKAQRMMMEKELNLEKLKNRNS
jgi:molecular chaperone GrpE (heat shock protein)